MTPERILQVEGVTLSFGGTTVLERVEFDADESEMTRSRKLRRDVLYARYAEMIETMYAGQEWIHVQTTVRYQDGSEGVIETDLRIVNCRGELQGIGGTAGDRG